MSNVTARLMMSLLGSISITYSPTNGSDEASNLTISHIPKFISSAVSPEARNEEFRIYEQTLSITMHRSVQQVSEYLNESLISRPKLPRWQKTANVVNVRSRKFVVDDTAFAEAEPLDEVSLSPVESWRTDTQIMSFRKAQFLPDF